MMRSGLSIVLTALLLAAGCSGSGNESVAEPSAETASESNEAAPTEDLVERAAEIVKAVEADPDSAEEILERFGVTVEQYEQMMYDISADPALSAAYEAALAE